MEKEKTKMKWTEFSNLEYAEDLNTYFHHREYSHSCYYHYTSVNTIDKILNCSFRISCVQKFNDECDKQQYGDEQQQRAFYALCFSSGTTENLAMWYLYSGLDGRGGRIGLKKGKLQKLIENSEYFLVELDADNNEVKEVMRLEEKDTMKITFRDVVYFQQEEKFARLKYNTLVNQNKFSNDEFKNFKAGYGSFFKDLIWYYEKEDRLLIELKGVAFEYVKNNPKKTYCVKMNYKGIKADLLTIDFAPEVDDAIYDQIIKDHENIRAFIKDTSKANKSQHAGKVKMNLCKRCAKIEELNQLKRGISCQNAAECKENKKNDEDAGKGQRSAEAEQTTE